MYVSNGNKKVKARIWNLPCKTTCKANLACHKYCYAQKAERIYPNVKPCRENNLKESQSLDFVEKMVDLIKSKRKVEYFRIHESGDFYSKAYVLKWYIIARKCPDVTFYAYTKRDDLFSPGVLAAKPKNLTLIYSVDGLVDDITLRALKVPQGFDKLAVVSESKNSCPAIKQKDIKCMDQCRRCASTKNEVIVFKKH